MQPLAASLSSWGITLALSHAKERGALTSSGLVASKPESPRSPIVSRGLSRTSLRALVRGSSRHCVQTGKTTTVCCATLLRHQEWQRAARVEKLRTTRGSANDQGTST
eukprot:Amastigsp_a844140_30.p3 type:complete len:108 gc:universal Amastigsp_a844140_30:506-829(+)